jgi:hypothetical protein
MIKKYVKAVLKADLYKDDPLTRLVLLTLADLADKYGKVTITDEELEKAVEKNRLAILDAAREMEPPQ